MNFDEPSEEEDDTDEERTPSLSPSGDVVRPASASSGKDTPVSSPDHPLPAPNTPAHPSIPPPPQPPGGGAKGVAHRRRRFSRRQQPRGVRLSPGSAGRHHQVSDQPEQEGHGPRPLPHLLHAHGEGGRQKSEWGFSHPAGAGLHSQ